MSESLCDLLPLAEELDDVLVPGPLLLEFPGEVLGPRPFVDVFSEVREVETIE